MILNWIRLKFIQAYLVSYKDYKIGYKRKTDSPTNKHKQKIRMSEQFDKNVPIKEELSANLIFGLKARPAIAIILGFVGYSHEVIPMM